MLIGEAVYIGRNNGKSLPLALGPSSPQCAKVPHHRPSIQPQGQSKSAKDLANIPSKSRIAHESSALSSVISARCHVQPVRQPRPLSPKLLPSTLSRPVPHPASRRFRVLPERTPRQTNHPSDHRPPSARATNMAGMDDFVSDSDSDYTSYWRDWVCHIFPPPPPPFPPPYTLR